MSKLYAKRRIRDEPSKVLYLLNKPTKGVN
jgi:hypothetical protein